jgi:hypothetical protein
MHVSGEWGFTNNPGQAGSTWNNAGILPDSLAESPVFGMGMVHSLQQASSIDHQFAAIERFLAPVFASARNER